MEGFGQGGGGATQDVTPSVSILMCLTQELGTAATRGFRRISFSCCDKMLAIKKDHPDAKMLLCMRSFLLYFQDPRNIYGAEELVSTRRRDNIRI